MSDSFFFIDDSGGRDWSNPYTRDFIDNPPNRSRENLPYWRRNYFVLAGIHISHEALARLNPYINQKKQEYFGTKHVEIKSEWLRVPEKRKKNYIKPFGITEEKLTEFIDDIWYPLFNPEDITIQAFVLDKRYYARRKDSPLAILSQVIFDRLVMYPTDGIVVTFDQMENSVRSVRNDHGTILRVSDQVINTSPYFDTYSHSQVRFEQSCNSNFLQLADTAAYNVFRQFVEHGHLWNKGGTSWPMYEYFKRIYPCLYKNRQESIDGFGVIKIPDTKRTLQQKKTS